MDAVQGACRVWAGAAGGCGVTTAQMGGGGGVSPFVAGMLQCELAGLGWPPNVRTLRAGLPRRSRRGVCAEALAGERHSCAALAGIHHSAIPGSANDLGDYKLDCVPASRRQGFDSATRVREVLGLPTSLRMGWRGISFCHFRSSRHFRTKRSRASSTVRQAASRFGACTRKSGGCSDGHKTDGDSFARVLPILLAWLSTPADSISASVGEPHRYTCNWPYGCCGDASAGSRTLSWCPRSTADWTGTRDTITLLPDRRRQHHPMGRYQRTNRCRILVCEVQDKGGLGNLAGAEFCACDGQRSGMPNYSGPSETETLWRGLCSKRRTACPSHEADGAVGRGPQSAPCSAAFGGSGTRQQPWRQQGETTAQEVFRPVQFRSELNSTERTGPPRFAIFLSHQPHRVACK